VPGELEDNVRGSRSNRWSACVVLIAVLAASHTLGSGIAAQSKPPEAGRKGFIWTFERGGRTGWLVGSLHLLKADHYPLPPSMEAAFARADTLVEEIDLSEATDPKFAASILAKGMYRDGSTLSTRLSRETYQGVSDWLRRNGLAIGVVEQLKPWMVAMTIQTMALQKIGFDPALGLDKYFEDGARKTGKRLMPLETIDEQLDFLDKLSPTTQDQMLRESIETADTELAEIQSLAAAWHAGNAPALEKIALSGMNDAPEVYQALLVERNRRWVPKIEACVQTRSCFVVVGAAHLIGPDGLIVMLRQRGFTLQQQ
jgi:uncharacterized protein YbaP (TraB family)